MDESAPGYGNSDYQGGTSNTDDPKDNAFRNIDKLKLGKLLRPSQGPRSRRIRKLKEKMPNASSKG